MSSILKMLILSVLGLFMAQAANATVITFDDIGSTSSFDYIPDGYAGFNWDAFGYINKSYNAGTGYENGTVSGDYSAFNYYANLATVDNGLFDFTSTYLTGAWNDGLNIDIEGWNGMNMLYSTTVVVDSTAATLFNFGWMNIDKLVFSSYGGVAHGYEQGGGTHFVMDNFTINESSVPEPSSLLLMGIGLVGLGFVRLRKQS